MGLGGVIFSSWFRSRQVVDFTREFDCLKFFVPQESAFFELETPVLPVFADFLPHASRVLVSILKICYNVLFTFKKSVVMKALPRYNGPHVKINQEALQASGEAIMAKPNSMFYCSLLGGESFDEFAHLGSLREVMEHMQDEELRHLLRRCREGGRQDWPVEAMLNAYYAMIVLQYRSVESLRRNLAANPTLMRVCGFPMKANQKDSIRVPSKSAFSRFMKLLEQLESEHGAMCALFDRNRDRLMVLCPDFGTAWGLTARSCIRIRPVGPVRMARAAIRMRTGVAKCTAGWVPTASLGAMR